jgi:DNA (cytosine-5)-methyltransferase 1
MQGLCLSSSTTTFYNDNDLFVAQWLRNLIAAGMISKGVVDVRDIRQIEPEELVGYRRVHFFAGIGGWELALQLAGWPPELPVWTGSCPCQPFSQAGRKKGFSDDRHLWPIWFNLIRECRPPIIFGEQVESQAAKAWLDTVFDDLEGIGYSCGAAVLPAASVGAPHLRHRIWFVAYTKHDGQHLPERLCGRADLPRTAGAVIYRRWWQ